MRIEQNIHGFYIVKTENGRKWYFSGTRKGKPVFVCDHCHSRDYKNRETAEKQIERLKVAGKDEKF